MRHSPRQFIWQNEAVMSFRKCTLTAFRLCLSMTQDLAACEAIAQKVLIAPWYHCFVYNKREHIRKRC
jgi:hypothetical protein